MEKLEVIPYFGSSSYNSRITNINTIIQPRGPMADYLQIKTCLIKMGVRAPPITPGKIGLTGSYTGYIVGTEYELEDGGIDVVDSPLDKYWIDRWSTNPDIILRDYSDIGKWQFDLNNQKWPTGCGDRKECDLAHSVTITIT